MTAAHVHPSWALTYRVHESRPSDPTDRAEWGVELLIESYVDTDDERFMQMLADSRPDLTWAQVFEAVEALCVLSGEASGYELRSESWTGAAQVARNEYQDALTALATVPDGAS